MDQSPATRQSLIVKLRDPADSGAWCEFVATLRTARVPAGSSKRACRTPTPETSARTCSGRWPGRSIAGTQTAAASAAGSRRSHAT